MGVWGEVGLSELNPALQPYTSGAQAVDAAAVADTTRLCLLTRNSGFIRGILPMAGRSSVADTAHINFMAGAEWDLRADGSSTARSYVVSAGSTTTVVVSVSLLVIYSRPPVLTGASFGAQYQGGLLNATTITPGALANGLQLTANAAGVASTLANLVVNEDLAQGPGGPQFGSLGGPYLLRARYDFNQTLTGGSSDRLTWLVRDDFTSRGIAEMRAVATVVAPQ